MLITHIIVKDEGANVHNVFVCYEQTTALSSNEIH